jgi:S1-C subfamily serine protease
MRGAQLASLERLRDVRVFDAVYAVGCPLGNDPIPTAGEVASVEHVVDGSTYWMISAPTYIGNSGGGIYDARTHELIGIFSKIYTHGSSRTTIVPHMGLVTPLYAIYDWLERAGYASLLLETPPREAQTASAAR